MLLRRCLPHDRRNHPHHLLHLYRRILQRLYHHHNQLLCQHLVQRIQEKLLILLNDRHRVQHHCRHHNLRLVLQDHQLIHQLQYRQINPHLHLLLDQVYHQLHVRPVKVKQQIRHYVQHLHRILDLVCRRHRSPQHNHLLPNHPHNFLRQDRVLHQLLGLPILVTLPSRHLHQVQDRVLHQLPGPPIPARLQYLLNHPQRRCQH
mmetsp:Transcript_16433/g.40086  ORF Transcript_16433/g.40086 Transcript_16433/m.40086 type:complete len:204 (-) Transcript_16433:193-804(-)